jgi:hypothetical protein
MVRSALFAPFRTMLRIAGRTMRARGPSFETHRGAMLLRMRKTSDFRVL